jgi:hypothetical protein
MMTLATAPADASTVTQNMPLDKFYHAKYDDDGNVVDDWSYTAWTLSQVADIRPFGTEDCTTVTKPRRKT